MKLPTSTIVARSTIATVMLAGACSGRSEVASFEEEFSVSAALSEVPISALGGPDGVAQIVAADIDAAAQLAGLERPVQTDSIEDVHSFFDALQDGLRDGPGLVFLLFPFDLHIQLYKSDADTPVEEMGFSVLDVSTYVAVRGSRYTVVTGVSPRDDLEEVSPGISMAGERLQLAEQGNRVGLSRDQDPLVDWLEESPGGTAADDLVLTAIAGQLDEQDVVSALLSKSYGGPILGFGMGWTVKDDKAVGVLVLAYESSTEASANVSDIEASLKGEQNRFADQMSVDDVKVEDAEVVVIVSFVGEGSPKTLSDLFTDFEGPFS